MTYPIRHSLLYIIMIIIAISYTFKTSYRTKFIQDSEVAKQLLMQALLAIWSSLRPISNSQLHVLPHFHLCPIYLVVFKGSYSLL